MCLLCMFVFRWELVEISDFDDSGPFRQYLCTWMTGESSWQPESDLTNCDQLLNQFWKNRKKQEKHEKNQTTTENKQNNSNKRQFNTPKKRSNSNVTHSTDKIQQHSSNSGKKQKSSSQVIK